ncbi:YifB family Mg chelatase-like AAA ATPase [Effusibacillus lacus]|uniref:Magnesium chelatase n=1 Tax=Effusibacillus lacus TaxID=1348429 RepID=A0A292YRN6_9BACL|nr:YifB family Mg chelatase-like AAA ATPase [Effusibacillus lacus]TCS76049.1 magnesium chelatase family protein [Effusibacillus lacus]GAX91433.1 magnesium chelatase [Effusibacillus lacus]
MYASVNGIALLGIQGEPILVEVDISNGIPCFDLVGLPSSSVREAKERVRAAIRNSGFEFPLGRITANLAPADLRKDGPGYDLGLALGILCANGILNGDKLRSIAVIGELALDGSVRPVHGVLPMAAAARCAGFTEVIVPAGNLQEARLVEGILTVPVRHLRHAIQYLKEGSLPPESQPSLSSPAGNNLFDDLADVRGQQHAKRALEIAASGNHNLVLIGPPGSGKTMLARRLPSILPPLLHEESLEVTMIHSTAGSFKETASLLSVPPFRSPHHSISAAGLIGGGTIPKPGEVSLAHCGVLFLDEMPEFNKIALEVLRQPLEEGKVTIARANASLTYPSRFLLVGAMNPCPCGYFGQDRETGGESCTCTPYLVQKYRNRLSGPLLDRIDLHVEVPRIRFTDIHSMEPAENSSEVLKRVQKARSIQQQRFPRRTTPTNSLMTAHEVRKFCPLTKEAAGMLRDAFEKLALSVRAHDRILKMARTIADLEEAEIIDSSHVAEAIQYRSLDRKRRISSC